MSDGTSTEDRQSMKQTEKSPKETRDGKAKEESGKPSGFIFDDWAAI